MNPYLRRSLIVVASVSVVVGVLVLGLWRCPFAFVFHVPCPSCGLTRATVAAVHGRWAESWRIHPLAVVVVPLLGAYVVAHSVSYIRYGHSNVDQVLAKPWVTAVLVLVALTLFVLWIARFFGAFGGPVPV